MAISAINLGNSFTNTNGTSVLGGVSSGINSQAIINSLVAAQSAQVTKLTDQVTVNNSKVSALSTLQTLLTQFQTAAKQLSTPQSPDSSANIFATNSAQVTANTTQAASNFLTATASASASAGTYTISDVSQLASSTSQLSSTTFTSTTASIVAASTTAGEFTAGTYTITGPSGSGTVTLSTTDNIFNVATDFNDATTNTGIQANVLQTAPGVYTLVFSSTATGSATNFDLSNSTVPGTVTDGGSPPAPLSLGGVSFSAPTAGKDAKFDFNGVPITRATNSFSDLVSGVTINLLQDTSTQPGANFTIAIAPDTASIQTAVTNFASSYNNLLTFYAQQTALNSDGTPASSAILYSDNALHSIYSRLTTIASSIVTNLKSGSSDQLADLGISFGNSPATSTTPAISNQLFVDTTALDSAIQTNLSGVENVFGYNLTSSSPNLVSFQSATSNSVPSFKLDVNQTGTPPTYVATYADTLGNIQTVNFTASPLGTGGVALTAPSTSALAGLILIYTGSGNESNISVSTSVGIAAQANSFVTSALVANTGLLAADSSGITKNTTSIQTQITNVNTQVTAQRQALLQKFSQLEAAISSANSSLNLLNAQQLANSSGG